jgi:hypothetical protein
MNAENSNTLHSDVAAAWLGIVQKQVSSLRYGEVQIIIHDGRVVQLQTTERLRFDKPPTDS